MLNEIFQFISTSNSSSLEKLLSEPISPKVALVIDLEDGIQDVIHSKRTAVLKRIARRNILSLVESPGARIHHEKIGFRINSIRSEELREDLKFLTRIRHRIQIAYLVIPKINSEIELNAYQTLFSDHQISYAELIPIIETVNGMKNLDLIFSSPPTRHFHRAFWGHHDFNLDAESFPFAEHRSRLYWEWTAYLIKKLETAGYQFINGAFLELDNDDFLKKIMSATTALCTKDFDAVALSYRQVKLFLSLQHIVPASYSGLIDEKKLQEQDTIALAQETMRRFEKNHLKEKGFSLNKPEAIIISPQQYLAARNYLHQHQFMYG